MKTETAYKLKPRLQWHCYDHDHWQISAWLQFPLPIDLCAVEFCAYKLQIHIANYEGEHKIRQKCTTLVGELIMDNTRKAD